MEASRQYSAREEVDLNGITASTCVVLLHSSVKGDLALIGITV